MMNDRSREANDRSWKPMTGAGVFDEGRGTITGGGTP